MKNFKNIIFDLGGVLLDVDFSKTQKAFTDLGVKNFHELFNQHHSSPLFVQLEKGEITPNEFYNAFRKAVKLKLTDTQIENAWNALLGTFVIEKLKWIEEIGRKYNIYLFSNTNQIHYDAFQKNYEQQTGKENFDRYFIKAWYSHEIGVRKPQEEAFRKVLELENLDPKETLFIDDTIGNIESAQKVGMQTIYLEKSKSVLDLNL
jgi:putative hydrolase of the HAD superfamily